VPEAQPDLVCEAVVTITVIFVVVNKSIMISNTILGNDNLSGKHGKPRKVTELDGGQESLQKFIKMQECATTYLATFHPGQPRRAHTRKKVHSLTGSLSLWIL